MKEKIERWYKQGLWNDDMVGNAVAKGILTSDQYKDITGKEYI